MHKLYFPFFFVEMCIKQNLDIHKIKKGAHNKILVTEFNLFCRYPNSNTGLTGESHEKHNAMYVDRKK